MQNSTPKDARTTSKDVTDAKIGDEIVKCFLNPNLLAESDLTTPGKLLKVGEGDKLKIFTFFFFFFWILKYGKGPNYVKEDQKKKKKKNEIDLW